MKRKRKLDDDDDVVQGGSPMPDKESASKTTARAPAKKRPDVAERRKRNRGMRTTTIKTALRKVTRIPDLVPLVERAVRAVTQITVEGSRFLNMLLLDLAERQQPLPEVSVTFVRRCFARFLGEARTQRSKNDPDAEQLLIDSAWERLYKPCRVASPSPLALASFGQGFGQILTYAAKDYETCCSNHVRVHFYRRFCAVMRRRARQVAPFLAVKRFARLQGALVHAMAKATLTLSSEKFVEADLVHTLAELLEPFSHDDELAGGVELLARDLAAVVAGFRKRHSGVLPIKACGRTWSKLLPLHYEMMRDAAEDESEASQREGVRRSTRWGRKQFSMLPVASLQAKFVTIDTRVLHDFLRRVDPNGTPSSEAEFRAASDAWWWSSAFDVQRLARKTDPTFAFGHLVKTDGVAANFAFQRPKQPGDINWSDEEETASLAFSKDKKLSWTTPLEKWPDPATVDPAKVVGVDPGRRDLVTAVYPNPGDGRHRPRLFGSNRKRGKAKRRTPTRSAAKKRRKRKHPHGGARKRRRHEKGEHVVSVSTAQWRHACGTKKRERQTVEWQKKDCFAVGATFGKSLFEHLRATPSPKVCTVAKFTAHVAHVLGVLGRVLDFNVDRKRVRRARFQAYIKRTKALDELCRCLSGGYGKDAVVVLGAAQCSSGFGFFPAPIKELRRRLEHHTRVVVLDEHFTSQRCSKCYAVRSGFDANNKLEPGRKQDAGSGGGGDGGGHREGKIHGVRWCPHHDCRTTWNRDVNAARNMRQVFLDMLFRTNLVRPPAFRHKGAQTAAA